LPPAISNGPELIRGNQRRGKVGKVGIAGIAGGLFKGARNASGGFMSRGERICCQTMQRIYGVSFKSTWPSWLINPETGEGLELDCYNDELKIAVEYNGEQH